MGAEDHQYSFALSVATLLMATTMADGEDDSDRQATKHRIVERKTALLSDAFRVDLARVLPHVKFDEKSAPPRLSMTRLEAALRAVTDGWTDNKQVALLVDLSLADPFAPYEVKTSSSDSEQALISTARAMELSAAKATEVLETREEALKAHRSLPWKKILMTGAIGTVVLAAGGWVFAPAIGAALGGAAGLSGTAATGYGLALLGGGSLAAGGAGMAGGLWLITGAGAVVGAVAGGTGQALRELGAAQARVELVKLQMSYRLNVLHGQAHVAKAQDVIAELDRSREELERQLEEERLLNDKNATRIKEIEKIVEAIEVAEGYVRDVDAA